MTPLAHALADRTDDLTEELRLLVAHESPTGDVARLDALSDEITDRWAELDATVRRHRVAGTGNHLEVRWSGPRGTPADTAPALLVGHYDTVHDLGALDRNPWRIDGAGHAWGPGTQDMKSGLVIARAAVAALSERGAPLPRPIVALLTADEEIGSPTSQGLIHGLAADCAYALVLEAATGSGAVKTQRKGVGLFTVATTGTAAHAGQQFFDGVNANVALARLIPSIANLSDHAAGTTVNVGVIRGGTRANVVAEHASADIDVRFADDAEAERVTRALTELDGHDVAVTVTGGINRPAMRRSPASRQLFATAQRCAEQVGFVLDEAAAGGASDGNFTAADGVATLDGLGGVGAGLHTDGEWVSVASLPQRAALVAELLATW